MYDNMRGKRAHVVSLDPETHALIMSCASRNLKDTIKDEVERGNARLVEAKVVAPVLNPGEFYTLRSTSIPKKGE